MFTVNLVSTCALTQRAHMSVLVLLAMSYKEMENAEILMNVDQRPTAVRGWLATTHKEATNVSTCHVLLATKTFQCVRQTGRTSMKIWTYKIFRRCHKISRSEITVSLPEDAPYQISYHSMNHVSPVARDKVLFKLTLTKSNQMDKTFRLVKGNEKGYFKVRIMFW